ncbi:MAG: monovalent cation/H(+) antiporter subunit G [Candidatus Aminicenantes bacterium]|nr:monovalent cation/H(+) antiporter subunit G [Candidatus Aminicenantes bacterium]
MIRHHIGMAFIWIGIVFDFLGVLGLLRLPDVYNRLQAGTKCITFGSAGLLFGIFILKGFTTFGFKVLLGIAFIFLTSPVAAHAIARASRRSGIPLCGESVVDLYPGERKSEEDTTHAPAKNS